MERCGVDLLSHAQSGAGSACPELIAAMAPGAVFLLEAYTPHQIGRGTGGPGDPDLLLTAARTATD